MRLALTLLLFGTLASVEPREQIADAIASINETRIVKPVSNRKPNPMGNVMILMYHRFGPQEKYMVRSYANFKQDLESLYKMGYRPVTVSQYVENDMGLPPGASPVVLTFDDSTETQFRYLKDGRIDPNSAVGMWRAFAEKHPDFPVRGTFYVLPNGPFENGKDGHKKVKQLLAWGCEIGSHTMTHTSLAKLGDEGVKRELAGSIEYLGRLGVKCKTMALPYGVMPKNGKLVRGFTYKGSTYSFQSVVWAGASPAPAPGSPKRRLYEIPRVWAYGGSLGIKYWLEQVRLGKSKPYVQR